MAQKKRARKAAKTAPPPKSKARVLVDEVESASDTLIREIRDGFNVISERVSSAARAAREEVSDTTSSVAQRVGSSEVTRRIMNALDQIEDIGEDLIHTIGERFEGLRSKVIKTTRPTSPNKAVRKKAASKKKAAKKKAVKKAKKAAVKKKAKKKAAKKKVAPNKKVAAKKKAAKTKKSARKKKT